jgi:hypothetical protein
VPDAYLSFAEMKLRRPLGLYKTVYSWNLNLDTHVKVFFGEYA